MGLINDVLEKAKNANWTLTDDFEFFFNNSSLISPTNLAESLELGVIAINVPELTSPEIDEVLGGERRIGVRLFENFRFTIKFRDYGGGAIRRYFQTIWVSQQHMYFDDIKSTVSINSTGKTIFYTTDALITSISSINFDNNSTQIAEFDVTFLARSYSDEFVSGIGTNTVSTIYDDPDNELE